MNRALLALCVATLATACESRCELSVVSRPTEIDAGVPEASVLVQDAAIDAPVMEVLACDAACRAPTRTLIVGDSEAGFVSRRLKEFKEKVHPEETFDTDFKGGTVIQYWAAGGNFRAALSRHPKPDTVIIFLGTNNYWQKTMPDVKPILDEVQSRGIRCIWVGPTEVQGKKWEINQLIKAAVTPTCTYVDTETLNIPLEDGVHPTYAGIFKWLNAIWEVK